MDLTSAEDSKTVRVACGLVLALIYLAIWFRFVVNGTVTKVALSMTGGLSLIENIDSVMNNLDRLSMNQRAYLYTGDERFAGQVAQSIMAIANNLTSIKHISVNDEPLQRKATILSHSIDWALESIGKTYDLQEHFGSGPAIALLDHDNAVEDAKEEALSLKKVATDGMFERVRTEHEIRSILEELF
jgi:CHASE3 domain sensor protein